MACRHHCRVVVTNHLAVTKSVEDALVMLNHGGSCERVWCIPSSVLSGVVFV